MVRLRAMALAALGALISASHAASNVTQPDPLSVNLAAGPVVGSLYRPAMVGPRACKSELLARTGELSRWMADDGCDGTAIAVFVMHAESDYLSFITCAQLQERGFTVLCAQNAVSKLQGETDVDFEPMMTAVNLGVQYLRVNLTDEVDTVVLFGHSGGGSLMAAYQNIAENGLSACNGTEKIYPCSDALADLEPADGIILADANYVSSCCPLPSPSFFLLSSSSSSFLFSFVDRVPNTAQGLSTMMLLSLGAEIIDENSATHINESLSIFNVANGFNATGASHYTPAFTRAFQSAVAARMQRLVAAAEARLAAIEAGNGTWADDEPFHVIDAAYGIENNKFFPQDIRFLSRTRDAWPLLHANGTTTTEVVHSVRVPANFGPSSADTYWGGALITSVVRFLSGYALRVGDDFAYNATDIAGVDWASSHFATVAAAAGISAAPLLAMGNTGHWEFLNAEKIYLAARSADKSVAFVEGASHTFDPCTACEAYYGQDYGDTIKTAFDHMAAWLSASGRFL